MVKLCYVEKHCHFFKAMHHVHALCTFWGLGITLKPVKQSNRIPPLTLMPWHLKTIAPTQL